jgi:hypothetical protein
MANVIHVMADGTIRDSIAGMVIPNGEFYIVVAAIQERRNREQRKECK